jgi:hypothetical protein
MTYKQNFCMSGVVPIPVIRVNYSGISGEGQECDPNSPFPWHPVKDGNAATPVIRNAHISGLALASSVCMCLLSFTSIFKVITPSLSASE